MIMSPTHTAPTASCFESKEDGKWNASLAARESAAANERSGCTGGGVLRTE